MVDDGTTSPTRALLDRFRNAAKDAETALDGEEYQKAMAFYYDASQAADEMTERFLTLLMKTAPSNSHRTMIIEVMSWRLRYFTAQYDYHLTVAQTLSGLPREEWIARLETILVLSKSLVDKFKQPPPPNLIKRIFHKETINRPGPAGPLKTESFKNITLFLFSLS